MSLSLTLVLSCRAKVSHWQADSTITAGVDLSSKPVPPVCWGGPEIVVVCHKAVVGVDNTVVIEPIVESVVVIVEPLRWSEVVLTYSQGHKN